MKIYFIFTNINGLHEDVFPFGLASIISMAKNHGHHVQAILVKTREQYNAIVEDIASYQPNLIGFTSVSSQFHFVKELAQQIKKSYPKVLIVCGGVHPTIYPRCITENNSLDAVFIGESEYAFIEFLDRLERGITFEDVGNLAFVQNEKFKQNSLKPLIKNLDVLPYPDRDTSFFDLTLKSVGYAPFSFSRGCPYLCSYCSNHAIARAYGLTCNTPRYRTAESSIREIEEVINKRRISKIAIVDDIFGIDKEWRREFCQKYKKRIKIRFVCLLRANFIDEEFVQLLKETGCYRVSVGVESGNDYIRNTVMNRNLSTDKIIKAFDLLRKYRLQTNAINIIGVPGETEELIWDTINLNRRLKPTSSGCNIFYPYKGTKLGDECFKNGLVNEKLYSDFSNERRASVLTYPEEYKKKLIYYRENWEKLINRFNLMWRSEQFIRFILMKMGLLNFLINTKRSILAIIYSRQRALKSSHMRM